MSNRYTASHWGAYQIVGTGPEARLEGLSSDPVPSDIADGWIDALSDAEMRIHKPAIRKGWLDGNRTRSGDDPFVEVDWDTALDLAAGELKRVKTEHGNSAIFAGSYGWASAGRVHHAQSQMRRFLNTIGGFTASKNTYSHAAGEVLIQHLTGLSKYDFQDQMTSWPEIAEHSELMVAFGGISPRTAQIDSSGTTTHEVRPWLAKAADNGMKIVNISPQRSDIEIEAQWIAPRPGTDIALMMAIAHELIRKDQVDREFIAKCTTGIDALEQYLKDKTPNWAAQICDIPEATITDLATRMASHRTMISTAWSIQRADHGEQPIWMALTLAAMLGQIGKPGGGFGFGYGSTTPVGRPSKIFNWPSIPQGKNPIKDFIPVARIADLLENPKGSFEYDGKTHKYPDTRLVYWAGGNPYHHHQDLGRLERAWQRPETIIVNDHSWTATARRADIVLPSTAPLERHDIMMNKRDPGLVYMSPVLDPPPFARDDFEIFKGLATRFGTEETFTEGRSSGEWTEWIWERCGELAKTHGFELPEFNAFKAQGYFECPDHFQSKTLLKGLVNDPENHPIGTPSGKLQLSDDVIGQHPTWNEPAEWLGKASSDELHLISPQPIAKLHGQLDNGSKSKSEKVNGREPCFLHPKAANARNIAAGDLVLVKSARGACLASAVLKDDIRADCAALATGATYDPQEIDGERICVHGNPNVLTIDKGASPISQGNIAHTCLVTVSKWEGEAPKIRALSQPPFATVSKDALKAPKRST